MADVNIVLDIKNNDGSSFHDLYMDKFTVSSVVMSLDDKIEGDIYYPSNSLSFTMSEYVEYKGIKYYLKLDVPPTIVRKDMTDDNSDLKGMTKYSLTFYHPMVLLYNIPFTDVAVSDDEKEYKSEDTTFYWIGTITDLVAKLNKNLENTLWTCSLQPKFYDDGTMSDVIQFDNQKVSDVLKTCYETYEVPYVIDGYNIIFGKSANEILNSDGITPFVFKMGQGLGLNNNDRTPKNNTVITRIAGYGSEDNIPNGYPKIQWTGDSSWDYTVDNSSTGENSYPIVDGIIDGIKVRLIKHPFTRNHLMPSIYTERVNKKINPYAVGYSKNTVLIDYYDAVDDADYKYTNHINTLSPSYYKEEFADIKPSIVDAVYNGQAIDVLKSVHPCDKNGTIVANWDDSTDDNGDYNQSYFKVELHPLGFDLYAAAAVTSTMSLSMKSGACNGCEFEVSVDWEVVKTCFYDTDGSFNPNKAERWSNGSFPDSTNSNISIIVKKDTDTFGTLLPSIYQQPKTDDKFVFLGIDMPQFYVTEKESVLDAAMKQYMLENNIAYYDYPFDFDQCFLTLNPNILSQIKTNVLVRFEYNGDILSLSVKEYSITYGDSALPTYKITLTDDVTIVSNDLTETVDGLSKLGSQVATLQAMLGTNILDQLLKKLDKTRNDSTPYSLGVGTDLTVGGYFTLGGHAVNNITVSEEGLAPNDQTLTTSAYVRKEINDRAISSISEDSAAEKINFEKGLTTGLVKSLDYNSEDSDFARQGLLLENNHNGISGQSYLEVDNLFVRKSALFKELVIEKLNSVSGGIVCSFAHAKLLRVFPLYGDELTDLLDSDSAILFDKNGDILASNAFVTSGAISSYLALVDPDDQSLGSFVVGDMALAQRFDGVGVMKEYWRVITSIDTNFSFDGKTYTAVYLSNAEGLCNTYSGSIGVSEYAYALSAPASGDSIVQFGNISDPTRRRAIKISQVIGDAAFTEYVGIGSNSSNYFQITSNMIRTSIGEGRNKFTGDFYVENEDSSLSLLSDKIYLTVTDAFNSAGISITSSTVTLQAEKVLVNNGTDTVAMFSDGKLSADLIDADSILASSQIAIGSLYTVDRRLDSIPELSAIKKECGSVKVAKREAVSGKALRSIDNIPYGLNFNLDTEKFTAPAPCILEGRTTQSFGEMQIPETFTDDSNTTFYGIPAVMVNGVFNANELDSGGALINYKMHFVIKLNKKVGEALPTVLGTIEYDTFILRKEQGGIYYFEQGGYFTTGDDATMVCSVMPTANKDDVLYYSIEASVMDLNTPSSVVDFAVRYIRINLLGGLGRHPAVIENSMSAFFANGFFIYKDPFNYTYYKVCDDSGNGLYETRIAKTTINANMEIVCATGSLNGYRIRTVAGTAQPMEVLAYISGSPKYCEISHATTGETQPTTATPLDSFYL